MDMSMPEEEFKGEINEAMDGSSGSPQDREIESVFRFLTELNQPGLATEVSLWGLNQFIEDCQSSDRMIVADARFIRDHVYHGVLRTAHPKDLPC